MKLADYLAAVLLLAGYLTQMARWLRVLQREHYDATSLFRFFRRWTFFDFASSPTRVRWRSRFMLSYVVAVVMVITLSMRSYVALAMVSGFYGLFCPWGLSIRGSTSPLEWTRRLRTVALVAVGFSLVVAALGALTPVPYVGLVLCVLAVVPVLNLATRVTRPFEERRAQRFVDQAVLRLRRVHPKVVAITGSYGKTSTKNHLAQLLHGDGDVVASPRSYNNRAGLSRAINENLAEGSRVFIAEMGTYGPGEIRELTSWCVPDIAVVTAIGPVHLERMKSLDVVERAKREITERAAVVVLNVDDERLARWVTPLRAGGKRVITVGSKNLACDLSVSITGSEWTFSLDGRLVGVAEVVVGVQPANLACALGVGYALGIDGADLWRRARSVSPVANRSNVVVAPSGVVVIDDTFNANPASAAAALALLSSLDLPGRRVVVTPGLVELGSEQFDENRALASAVAALPAELAVVARTNARALQAGSSGSVRHFGTRDAAVAWVRSSLVAGDGVLYLNDLPDHYP